MTLNFPSRTAPGNGTRRTRVAVAPRRRRPRRRQHRRSRRKYPPTRRIDPFTRQRYRCAAASAPTPSGTTTTPTPFPNWKRSPSWGGSKNLYRRSTGSPSERSRPDSTTSRTPCRRPSGRLRPPRRRRPRAPPTPTRTTRSTRRRGTSPSTWRRSAPSCMRCCRRRRRRTPPAATRCAMMPPVTRARVAPRLPRPPRTSASHPPPHLRPLPPRPRPSTSRRRSTLVRCRTSPWVGARPSPPTSPLQPLQLPEAGSTTRCRGS